MVLAKKDLFAYSLTIAYLFHTNNDARLDKGPNDPDTRDLISLQNIKVLDERKKTTAEIVFCPNDYWDWCRHNLDAGAL